MDAFDTSTEGAVTKNFILERNRVKYIYIGYSNSLT